MKKCNYLFFFLVALQLNIGMDEALRISRMKSDQKNKFFFFDEQNNEIKITLKLKKEFQGKITPNTVFLPFQRIVESLPSDREAENFDGYLEKYLHSLNQASRKDEVKDGLSFNQSLLLKTKKQLNDIKENKGKYTVGALVFAVLTGYYFRQGIDRNITKVKNYLRSAWKYIKEKAFNFR